MGNNQNPKTTTSQVVLKVKH
jgi:predicted nicotinamide N-methyase